MSDPFVGEIRMFAGNFAPRGWSFCDGQLLSVSQNDALFSLLGTIYGGDGRTTFGLPDLRGRLALHAGQGPGLTDRRMGQKGGAERVTLSSSNLASHNHALHSGGDANADFPGDHYLANTPGSNGYSTSGVLDAGMAGSTGPAGSASPQSHENMMPYTCINYIISLVGIYPSRF